MNKRNELKNAANYYEFSEINTNVTRNNGRLSRKMRFSFKCNKWLFVIVAKGARH